jgi:two-component system, OmpR family, response regulator
MKILVVEDEDRIASFLDKGLTAYGFVVERVATGRAALAAGCDPEFDLAILDLGLPDLDGIEVLRRWRREGNEVPVIVLTARDKVSDRIRGLDLGADDYLPKPFAFKELLARVRARLRPRAATTLEVGGVRLDFLSRDVWVDGRPVDLTVREFVLLEEFVRHPNQILTREQLLGGVWKLQFDPRSNLVDVYVGYLRRKLGDGLIQTVRGEGYRLRVLPTPP